MTCPFFTSFSFSMALTAALIFPAHGAGLIDPAALGFGPPAFTADFTVQGSLDYQKESGGIDLYEFRALAPLAKWESGSWLVGAGLNYAGVQADFGGAFGVEEKSLHQIELQLFGAYEKKSSPWWGLGFLSPGMASDFKDPGSDALTATGLGLIGYHWNERLDLAAGVFAAYSLGEATVLPAVGFIWRPTQEWIVQATPPIVAIGWQPTAAWTLGLVGYPAGGGWEVGEKNEAVRQIDLTLWRAALSVERRFGPHWRVNVRGGMAFGGEVEFRDASARVLSSSDLDPAPFGAVAVKWAF
jgi:hypothetical protein